MPYLNRTYRIEDGERIEGSWRHIFIKNGNTYFLSALKVYADGMIDCWVLVDFTTFQQKVASGWVATTFPQGARASAHHLADWRFDELRERLTQQQLIAEVADEIEHWPGVRPQKIAALLPSTTISTTRAPETSRPCATLTTLCLSTCAYFCSATKMRKIGLCAI